MASASRMKLFTILACGLLVLSLAYVGVLLKTQLYYQALLEDLESYDAATVAAAEQELLQADIDVLKYLADISKHHDEPRVRLHAITIVAKKLEALKPAGTAEAWQQDIRSQFGVEYISMALTDEVKEVRDTAEKILVLVGAGKNTSGRKTHHQKRLDRKREMETLVRDLTAAGEGAAERARHKLVKGSDYGRTAYPYLLSEFTSADTRQRDAAVDAFVEIFTDDMAKVAEQRLTVVLGRRPVKFLLGLIDTEDRAFYTKLCGVFMMSKKIQQEELDAIRNSLKQLQKSTPERLQFIQEKVDVLDGIEKKS